MSDSRLSFHDQIKKNKNKSIFLIFLVFLIIIALGYIISLIIDPAYSFIVLMFSGLFSIIYVLITYYNSEKIALMSVNAYPAHPTQYKQYHNIVEGLCIASGIPKPKLYIMKSDQINAFATGRDPDHAVICVTSGCLEKLNKQELEGVLAHELSHIQNYDVRFMTLTAVMVGAISMMAQIFLRSLWFKSNNKKESGLLLIIGLFFAILAPIVATIVQMAISRKREYTADASAVKIIRSPTGLIGALKKIKSEHEPIKVSGSSRALFISDPWKGVYGLFQTHPPLDERIKVLERM